MSHLGQLALVWVLVIIMWVAVAFVIGLDYGRGDSRQINRVLVVWTALIGSVGLAVSIGVFTTNATW